MEKWIYVLSVSFQITGAVLLIIKYWFGSAKHQLMIIQSKRTHVENGALSLGCNGPSDREFIKELWLSRIAFLSIVIGYILGVFGDISTINKWEILIEVVVCSFIIIVLVYIIVNCVSRQYADR